MITGDNIFLAIQTAFKVGIFPDNATVIAVEGKHVANPGSHSLVVLRKNEQHSIVS